MRLSRLVTNRLIIPNRDLVGSGPTPKCDRIFLLQVFLGCPMGMLRLGRIVFPHPVGQFSAFWILLATFS